MRVLGALVDFDRCADIVEGSLQAAALDGVPETFDDLITLLVPHVVQRLHDPERPWVTTTFVEDLEAEAENDRLGTDQYSSARMAIATRIPARLPTPLVPDAETQHTHIPHNPAPRLPDVPPPSAPPDTHRHSSSRVVLIWNRDRFARANLARQLVRAGWDVAVTDDAGEVDQLLTGGQACDLLVLDPDDEGSDRILALLESVALLLAE